MRGCQTGLRCRQRHWQRAGLPALGRRGRMLQAAQASRCRRRRQTAACSQAHTAAAAAICAAYLHVRARQRLGNKGMAWPWLVTLVVMEQLGNSPRLSGMQGPAHTAGDCHGGPCRLGRLSGRLSGKAGVKTMPQRQDRAAQQVRRGPTKTGSATRASARTLRSGWQSYRRPTTLGCCR